MKRLLYSSKNPLLGRRGPNFCQASIPHPTKKTPPIRINRTWVGLTLDVPAILSSSFFELSGVGVGDFFIFAPKTTSTSFFGVGVFVGFLVGVGVLVGTFVGMGVFVEVGGEVGEVVEVGVGPVIAIVVSLDHTEGELQLAVYLPTLNKYSPGPS